MIEFFKKLLFVRRHFKEKRRVETNLYNAKKYAILALSYWKDAEYKADLKFQIEGTEIYVKLGK